MHSNLKNRLFFWLFLLLLIFTDLQAQKLPPNPNFGSPLDIPLYLSSNYGEYRSGHFHAGVDFKTKQVENKNVYSVDSGYIYRIAVLAAGYGKALYIRHPSGYVTLYGHLNQFDEAVEKYVKDQQYSKKSFTVDLYPEPDCFVYRKGDWIGLSGNTGMSFGAHLHFEIRDKSGAIPLNPLEYGFDVSDRTRPEIRWLMVYPIDTNSFVNGTRLKLPFKTYSSGRTEKIRPDTINVWGNIGIGIETYDFLDRTANQCGPSTIEVLIDDRPVFYCHVDSISFNSAGYIYSFYDYDDLLRSGRKIQKLFIEPNNRLPIYKLAINRGILDMRDSENHQVSIRVSDTYGNQSALEFVLRSVEVKAAPPVTPDPFVVQRFYYDSLNVFETPNVKIALQAGALFDNIDFRYFEEQNDSFKYSLVHKVHQCYTPLFRPYILSVKVNSLPESLRRKAYIASRGPGSKWVNQGGEYARGFVTASVKIFGDFIIAVDTVAPSIKPVNFTAKGNYTAGKILSFSITDSLSGIRKYEGYIDRKWALFEYDLKSGLLSYKVDPERLTSGKMHELEIIVSDNKGNVGKFRSSFYF